MIDLLGQVRDARHHQSARPLGAVIGVKQDAKYQTPENVEKNLKTYASYGVTTVLSMGTDKDFILQHAR